MPCRPGSSSWNWASWCPASPAWVVHTWPSGGTYCRSSSHISHRAGGSALSGCSLPQVAHNQIVIVSILHSDPAKNTWVRVPRASASPGSRGEVLLHHGYNSGGATPSRVVHARLARRQRHRSVQKPSPPLRTEPPLLGAQRGGEPLHRRYRGLGDRPAVEHRKPLPVPLTPQVGVGFDSPRYP